MSPSKEKYDKLTQAALNGRIGVFCNMSYSELRLAYIIYETILKRYRSWDPSEEFGICSTFYWDKKKGGAVVWASSSRKFIGSHGIEYNCVHIMSSLIVSSNIECEPSTFFKWLPKFLSDYYEPKTSE